MGNVLAPASQPEPRSRFSNITRQESFLRNATKW